MLISRGPEYDVEFHEVDIQKGTQLELKSVLKRVVDTSGWEYELHSHSRPSEYFRSVGAGGELTCERLEFAYCTEHQRIESYDDQLEILNAAHLMSSGMS